MNHDLERGMKFRSYANSVGGKSVFWVDTLCFGLNGEFGAGDILVLDEFEVDPNRISLQVHAIDKRVDVPVKDLMVPVSLVGLDRETVLEPHPNIAATVTMIKNENRIFLILLKLAFGKRSKIRIPLPGTENLIEYVVES